MRVTQNQTLRVLLITMLVAFVISGCDAQPDIEERASVNRPLDFAAGGNHEDFADLEGVPMYPGATNIHEVSRVRNGIHVSFDTPDLEEIVYPFYKSKLLQAGWQLVHETTYHPSFSVRLNSQNPDVPNKDLEISHETLLDGQGRYSLFLKRWPNPNDLPQPPLVRNFQSVYEKSERGNFLSQVITYTAETGIDELSSFFEAKMPAVAWHVKPPDAGTRSISSVRTLDYVFSMGKDHKGRVVGGRATIELTPLGDTQTEVKIIVRGFGLSEPNDARK
jgi:hypothetical protein